ncbi:carbonic anhydrase [Nocardia terpenica]|uniref:carbonic anhydrase n=1 Tax=Nocardia terpenica TaxID=455432 RepID=UPI0018948DC3|nr:carbonic anhydrase [Nocardia terpenica]MBF6061236.1 carbonic anhydrase [Nocardia terpenica]MBF6105535.1 carbonic anhydrase [Nocardia terpenica]MBF6112995.1 carbonic anhydrase [Nocardia terpenica]MBF6119125.1 carbonic anhydrase [Nocardia terpenica]MBF6152773.1 carbonic anhydrase [Nocardia terpenica]
MHDLAEGIAQFRREVFTAKSDLFAHLAATHTPDTLFIGCSDARVVPELITSSEPGELFVIRTAGNLVPAYGSGADAVAASIEYAVAVLEVARIVVCGHSACGAMTALAQGHDLTAVPMVAEWLRHADAARARVADNAVGQLIRRNVVAQLTNLATHPSVARRLADHSLTLHGWVFDIPTGAVEELPADIAAVARHRKEIR